MSAKSQKQKRSEQPKPTSPDDLKKPEMPNMWTGLAKLKESGDWDGEIETHQVGKEISLTKGEHYYILSDKRKRIVECIACPVKHGGILEAHMLTRYKVEDGVIYLDGEPTNKRSATMHKAE